MSAGVDQRGKGQPNQVSNGQNKEPMKEEFDAYLNQPQHQVWGAYPNSGPMSSTNVSEPYMANYYPSMTFPYMGQGMDNTAWSNGDPMSFLGGYGQQMNNEYMGSGGMFSGFGYQPGFSFSGDYSSAWGINAPRKDDRAAQAYADSGYYGMPPSAADGYAAMNGDFERDMKGVESSMKGMSMGGGDKSPLEGGSKDMHHVGSNSGGGHGGGGGEPASHHAPPPPPQQSAPPAKKTWASIASQPAKPQTLKPKTIPRAPVLPTKHNMDIGTWETRAPTNKGSAGGSGQQGQQPRQAWSARRATPGSSTAYASPSSNGNGSNGNGTTNGTAAAPVAQVIPAHPVLDKLRSANLYNPKEFNLIPKNARYFIIKSYSEDDIHRSIKYSIWCSTDHGNKRLDAAYRERESKGPIFLFYSVNGSGHFCGMAQMMSNLDYSSSSSVWAQDKWKGQFEVKWIYVKDVPNSQLRHIKLENNENKPVTNSRDTQEVPPEKGKLVLKILHNYRHTTSIFDDFVHYEKRQEEDVVEKVVKEEPAPERRPERSQNEGGREGAPGGGRDRRERGERGGDRRERGGNRDDRDNRGDHADRGGRRQQHNN